MGFIIPPATGRFLVERLAHLPNASRFNRRPAVVKVEAGRIKWQVEEGQDLPDFEFRRSYQRIIIHIDNLVRSDGFPMRHELLISTVLVAEMGEVEGVRLRVAEVEEIVRQARVEGVSDRVKDARIRKQPEYETDMVEIVGAFVRDDA